MFIKNGTTYVNLDQVAKAAPGQRMGGRDTATGFFAVNGNLVDSTGTLPDLEYATAPLVPSSAVVIAIDPMGQISAHPVAAFRVLRDGTAEPIYTVAPPEAATLFQMAGGQTLVGLSDGRLFADLAAAKAAVTGMPAPAPAPAGPEREPELAGAAPKLAAGGRRHGVR